MTFSTNFVGVSCAYAPLAILDAAGFAPYRLLPADGAPARAGGLLHDNLCPHVKGLLDRALEGDLPPMAGCVFMNGCDAMRRLADAWTRVRPRDRTAFVELPVAADERSVLYFAERLREFAAVVGEWSGAPLTEERLAAALNLRNEQARLYDELRAGLKRGTLKASELQRIYNASLVTPIEADIARLKGVLAQPEGAAAKGVPLFLFGNVLFDPEAFEMFESLGARIVAEDFCTGSRAFSHLAADGPGDMYENLARALLRKPKCARTFDPPRPGLIGGETLRAARESGARGAAGIIVKFCDPYISRLPRLREAFKKAGLPLLALEGDCTLRSAGQHRTRIEAFIEMLG